VAGLRLLEEELSTAWSPTDHRSGDEAAAFGVPVARRMSSQLVKRNLGLVLGYQVRRDQHMSSTHAPACPAARRPRSRLKDLIRRVIAMAIQGTRYHGLQMATQPNTPTVEAEVHRALHAAGAISDSNNGDRNKVERTLVGPSARMLAGTHAHSLTLSPHVSAQMRLSVARRLNETVHIR